MRDLHDPCHRRGFRRALVARAAAVKEFAPGFRLSLRDVVVILLGIATAAYLFGVEPWWSFIVVFVVAHFFLFCNVVRMARPLELIWAATFLALASATLLTEAPGWPITV